MRTVSLRHIADTANSISHLATSNCVADVALSKNYTYSDYKLLCLCRESAAITEKAYALAMADRSQLQLEGIY